jgi:hypothetical protein
LLFYALVVVAGLCTFAPVQYTMGLSRLTLEGVVSTSVLLYTLAFVPPPTDWLLFLPDLPVYLLFTGALFWSTAAVALPFVYAAGKRLFKHRARQRDAVRAWRQSYELGALVACSALLAALQVLTWVSLLLLVLMLVIAELLFLSRVKVERPRR